MITGDKLCNQDLLCNDNNNNTKQLKGSKEHQSADWCSGEIDAPCPFTKGIFLHSKRGVSVWTNQAPQGTVVQSADVHVQGGGARASMFCESGVLRCEAAVRAGLYEYRY